jgi:hypothetical protein
MFFDDKTNYFAPDGIIEKLLLNIVCGEAINGETIIKAGQELNYFYMIKKG